MKFQCYFEDPDITDIKERRCKEMQEDYWCSEEHRNAWQEANYGKAKNKGKKLTIKQIQKRLIQMGKEASNVQTK